MRKRRHTIRAEAVRLLTERLGSADARGRLPPIRQLAAEAGVSYVTMCNAVRELRRQGRIAARGRLRLASQERGGMQDVGNRKPAWRRIAESLERDIATGVFSPAAQLASGKELSSRYGCCYRTLYRALDELLAAGLLERSRRGWRVARSRHASDAAIVLVLRGQGDGIYLYPIRTWEYFRVLESDTSRAGILVRSVTLQFTGTNMNTREVLQAIERLHRDIPLIGFMLWTMGLGSFDSGTFVRNLSRYGLPVSVLDEVEHCPADLGSRLPGLCHIRVAHSPHAGLAVGEHLLGLGHRRVAFITHVPDARYSTERLNGLQLAFQRAGLSRGAVSAHVPVPFSRDMPDGTADAFLAPPRLNVTQKPYDQPETESQRNQRYDAVMGHVMRGLLDDAAVSAWVCVSDELAVYALTLLRGAHVCVPEDISVCGFDDTLDATRMRLSSYNFNNFGVVRACLEHLLNPGARFRRPPRKGPIEIEGFVVRRQSSGRARRDA